MIPDSSVPKLTTHRVIDQNSGRTSTTYLWDGVPIPQVTLSGAVAEQMSGLALIQKDLENALRWIDKASELLSQMKTTSGSQGDGYVQMKDREVGNQVKAFFVSALVFYAKSFTEAAGRRAQMARDWLDVEYRDSHDYFMKYRHNMAAHSGDEKLEIGLTCLMLIPSDTGYTYRIGTHRCQPDLAILGGEEKQFSELIKHAMAKVSERYNKAATKTIQVAYEQGDDFWLNASAKNETIDATQLHKNAS